MSRYDSRTKEAEEYRKWYSLAAWKKLRKAQLAKDPLCKFCTAMGRTTPANVVDHRTPHRGDAELFFDPENLDSLCKWHHDNSKRQIEEFGYHTQAGPDGWPLDENHPSNKWRNTGFFTPYDVPEDK